MDNTPINPWLAQVILEYRRNHSDDDELRKGYRAYIKDGSTYYSWSDYVGRIALEWYANGHPVLLMTRSEMPLPQHTRDTLNYHSVHCLADLIQVTTEELDMMFTDKKRLNLLSVFLPVKACNFAAGRNIRISYV